MQRKFFSTPLVCITAGFVLMALAGCNLFTTMHSDGGTETTASVLVADGNAALRRGDYRRAEDYFRMAIEHDYWNAEARVGYAEAYLKNPTRGFSLGKIVNTLLDQMKSEGSGETVELLKPEDWGVATMSELSQTYSLLIFLLDPITQGQTHGPYRRNDVSLNLNVGVFYLLRFGANVQAYLGGNRMVMVNKNDRQTDLINAGFSLDTLNALSEDFIWFEDISGTLLSPNPLAMLRSDVELGIARLQTAAQNSSSQALVEDVIEMFDDWRTILNAMP